MVELTSVQDAPGLTEPWIVPGLAKSSGVSSAASGTQSGHENVRSLLSDQNQNPNPPVLNPETLGRCQPPGDQSLSHHPLEQMNVLRKPEKPSQIVHHRLDPSNWNN